HNMSEIARTTVLCFLFLWNIVHMNAKQCQVAKNVLIEKVQGNSGVVSRVTVDYGTFTSCVIVENSAIISSQLPASAKFEKSPPKPLYELVPGMGYYKMHNEPKTWDQAMEICEREGAHLGIANSRRESRLFMELHNRLPLLVDDWRKNYGYVGIQKRNGTWLTIFDEPIKTVGSQWGGGQPKQIEGNDCAMLYTLDGLLHDTNCNNAVPFFCEREL
ncbi:hypothetical protein L9F63_000508, partial [Diploptera punctata]